MKIELIKIKKPNGDLFYWVTKNGEKISDCVCYGGNQSSTQEELESLEQVAFLMYTRYLEVGEVNIEVIKSTIIKNN